MRSHFIETKERIEELIDFLISRKREITVQIEGNRTSYKSRVIKANYKSVVPKIREERELIIERFTFERGNSAPKLFHKKVVVGFMLSGKFCQFSSRYLRESTEYPHIGFVLTFPESVAMKERRNYDRNTKDLPDFVSATFTVKKGAAKSRTYELKIISYSPDGIGMLVTKDDLDLLEILEEGDALQDFQLYAPRVMVKVAGTVRHKTKLDDTKQNGSYILGVKLDEPLEDFESI